jgi:hypothetical protein
VKSASARRQACHYLSCSVHRSSDHRDLTIGSAMRMLARGLIVALIPIVILIAQPRYALRLSGGGGLEMGLRRGGAGRRGGGCGSGTRMGRVQ